MSPVFLCAALLSPQGGVREPGRLDLNIVHSSQNRLRRRAQGSRVMSALNRIQRPISIHWCPADGSFNVILPLERGGISWEICNVLNSLAASPRPHRGK